MNRPKTDKKPALRFPARSQIVQGREPKAARPGTAPPIRDSNEKKGEPVNLIKRPKD